MTQTHSDSTSMGTVPAKIRCDDVVVPLNTETDAERTGTVILTLVAIFQLFDDCNRSTMCVAASTESDKNNNNTNAAGTQMLSGTTSTVECSMLSQIILPRNIVANIVTMLAVRATSPTAETLVFHAYKESNAAHYCRALQMHTNYPRHPAFRLSPIVCFEAWARLGVAGGGTINGDITVTRQECFSNAIKLFLSDEDVAAAVTPRKAACIWSHLGMFGGSFVQPQSLQRYTPLECFVNAIELDSAFPWAYHAWYQIGTLLRRNRTTEEDGSEDDSVAATTIQTVRVLGEDLSESQCFSRSLELSEGGPLEVVSVRAHTAKRCRAALADAGGGVVDGLVSASWSPRELGEGIDNEWANWILEVGIDVRGHTNLGPLQDPASSRIITSDDSQRRRLRRGASGTKARRFVPEVPSTSTRIRGTLFFDLGNWVNFATGVTGPTKFIFGSWGYSEVNLVDWNGDHLAQEVLREASRGHLTRLPILPGNEKIVRGQLTPEGERITLQPGESMGPGGLSYPSRPLSAETGAPSDEGRDALISHYNLDYFCEITGIALHVEKRNKPQSAVSQ